MTFTPSTIAITQGTGTTAIAYTDGTNFAVAHPLLDSTGAIISPALSANQLLAPLPSTFTGTTLTRLANTTAYATGQVVYSSGSGAAVTNTIQVAKATNQAFTLLRLTLKCSGTVVTNAVFRVHLYNSQPTLSNGDGGTWLTGSTGWIGSFDVTCTEGFTDAIMGIGIPSSGSVINNVPVSGQNYCYYIIEARASYTPISSETFIPIVEVQ